MTQTRKASIDNTSISGGVEVAEGSDILVPGPLPLTRAMVTDYVAFFEWQLDVKVTADLYELIEADCTEGWQTGNREALNRFGIAMSIYYDVVKREVEQRDAMREERQAEFVKGLRVLNPSAAGLIALYDTANLPIASGNPPLTRECANCYFDLLALAQSPPNSTKWEPLPDTIRAIYTQLLAAEYPSMAPGVQQWFAGLPKHFTALRVKWSTMSLAARAADTTRHPRIRKFDGCFRAPTSCN